MRQPSHLQADLSTGMPRASVASVGARCYTSRRPRHALGFTMVELLITISVAAIMLVIAVPSFNNIINSNRLTTAANEAVGALNLARMEAIKRNASTQFCSDSATSNTSDTLGAACTTQSGAVYVLTSSTAQPPQVRASVAALTMPVQLHGHIAAIRFNGLGLGYAPGNTTTPYDSTTAGSPLADICTTALSSNNHVQIQMTTGTIITTTLTSGACP